MDNLKCRNHAEGKNYGKFWQPIMSKESFTYMQEVNGPSFSGYISEAPCKNMTFAKIKKFDSCCKMADGLNQHMLQIYKIMKYAMQAPHAIETLDDFLASFGNSSLLQYQKKTPQPKHVTNPAIPMCQYAGNFKNANKIKLCH